MELVRGIPITSTATKTTCPCASGWSFSPRSARRSSTPTQKGIIHRDIKPTNVLVTQHDGQPVVKVIDFGVAKAMGQQLTEKTLFTEFAQMIGTPLYMSPEQAELMSVDIDTRSDIYSLGVLLYELLTGHDAGDKERP
jgi:eukaryotic-like serine/threonine-protein kinase